MASKSISHPAYFFQIENCCFYPDVFARQGITLFTPNPDDQDYLHAKYMGELLHGVFLPETRAQLLTIIERLREQRGIQALILGGTELPLILPNQVAAGIPLLDTARIHVKSALARMLD